MLISEQFTSVKCSEPRQALGHGNINFCTAALGVTEHSTGSDFSWTCKVQNKLAIPITCTGSVQWNHLSGKFLSTIHMLFIDLPVLKELHCFQRNM